MLFWVFQWGCIWMRLTRTSLERVKETTLHNVSGPHSISWRPEFLLLDSSEPGHQCFPAFRFKQKDRHFLVLEPVRPLDSNDTINSPSSQAFRLRLELSHWLSWVPSLPAHPADLGSCQPPQSCEPTAYNQSINILFILFLWRTLIQSLSGLYSLALQFLYCRKVVASNMEYHFILLVYFSLSKFYLNIEVPEVVEHIRQKSLNSASLLFLFFLPRLLFSPNICMTKLMQVFVQLFPSPSGLLLWASLIPSLFPCFVSSHNINLAYNSNSANF